MLQWDHALLLKDAGRIVDAVRLKEFGREQVASDGGRWASRMSAALD